MQQQWERIECDIVNVPDLDSLLLETDAVAQKLNDTHDVIQSGTVRWSGNATINLYSMEFFCDELLKLQSKDVCM